MIFQIGKVKSSGEKPLQDETLNRWRQAASKDVIASPEENVTKLDSSWEIGSQSDEIRPVTSAMPRLEKQLVIEKVVSDAPRPSTLFSNDTPYVSRALPSDPSLSIDDDLARRFGSRVKAALGPGATIQGKLTFESPVRIDGSLVGEVTSTSTLIVGEQGTVQAEVKVGSLVVFGTVTGNVTAQDLVEIRKGGRIEANIQASRLVIEDGALFEGRSSMNKR
jgi:cytoskeletal protein CcmA (bactofilin family)